VQKWWAVFFGLVLLATFLIWFVAPFYGWWLPEPVSSYGPDVDYLFYVIMGFTGFFFVLTEVVLVYAMWKFAHDPERRSTYTHGNHTLELVWTAVPAAILLFIAFAQIYAWQAIKYQAQMPSPDVTISLLARQWEWRFRYPADGDRFNLAKRKEKDPSIDAQRVQRDTRAWAETQEIDDLHVANEVHCWKGCNVKIYLRTQDVLHSLTFPNLRLKQDTLPGKTIPMWFKPIRANTRFDASTGKVVPPVREDSWEIACQELCGARHYAMRGKLYVHDTEASYKAWLADARAKQAATLPTARASAGN
jgi:cytochrome c oxidase subunit II